MVEVMETKTCFQKTELGYFPVDWKIEPLGQFVKITSGESPSKFKFLNEGTPYFKVEQLNNDNKYANETKYFIKSDNNIPKGSIIFPKRGASIFLNKIRILEQGSFMDTNLMTVTVKDEIDNEYLFYQLSHIGLSKIADTTSIPQINNKHINPFLFPLPPTKAEQTAIATALNDADALITHLEKLIDKKRNIKQGAMQELLKPKDGWEAKKLGEIFNFKQGVQCPVEKQFSTYQEGLKRFIRIIDLTQRDEMPRFILDPGSSHHVLRDDLFMVRYGTPGLLGYGFEGIIANNLFRLIPKKKINTYFFYFLLFFKNTDIAQISSSTTMAALNFTALRELELSYPIDLKIQTHIAQVISDMDNEIEVLEKKLDKYKMIKQGMMQNLLTGRIRLV